MASWCFKEVFFDGEIQCHRGRILQVGVDACSISTMQDRCSFLLVSQAYSGDPRE